MLGEAKKPVEDPGDPNHSGCLNCYEGAHHSLDRGGEVSHQIQQIVFGGGLEIHLLSDACQLCLYPGHPDLELGNSAGDFLTQTRDLTF